MNRSPTAPPPPAEPVEYSIIIEKQEEAEPVVTIKVFQPPEGQWTGDEPPGQARQPVQVKEITVETIEQPEPEPLIITVETIEQPEPEPLIITVETIEQPEPEPLIITVETIEQPEPEPLIITVETETVEHEPLIITVETETVEHEPLIIDPSP